MDWKFFGRLPGSFFFGFGILSDEKLDITTAMHLTIELEFYLLSSLRNMGAFGGFKILILHYEFRSNVGQVIAFFLA